jgi:hypothetical protein
VQLELISPIPQYASWPVAHGDFSIVKIPGIVRHDVCKYCVNITGKTRDAEPRLPQTNTKRTKRTFSPLRPGA